MVYLQVATNAKHELKDITRAVKDAVADIDAGSGVAFIYVPHTTAAVTVNESHDPDVASDIEHALASLIPADRRYAHAEGNSDAHIKAALVGACIQIPVEESQLRLGRWQGVFLCEFDGPRHRKVWVQVLTGIR